MHTKDAVSRCNEKERYQLGKWSEDCLARIFSWFREYRLQRNKSMKVGETDEGIEQQQSVKFMEDMMRKIKDKGQNGREQQLVGQ